MISAVASVVKVMWQGSWRPFCCRIEPLGYGDVAWVVVLLSFASLGLGLLISTIVDSERQAVQLSMLVLLASVFFSGFVLPLDQFITPLRIAAYSLPVTHGIQLLQDYMLRGGTNAQGLPSSGPKDVVGVFTSEAEAQSALARLATSHGPVSGPPTAPHALRG